MATTIAPKREDLLRRLRQQNGVCLMFIDGGFAAASDGGTRKLINPADGEVVAVVAEGTKDDAERAIRAAREAFDNGPWSETHAQDRAKLLFQLADKIDENATELARLETLNNGKPVRETEYDVSDAANCFRYYAGLATKPHGETFDVPAPSQTFVVREPIEQYIP